MSRLWKFLLSFVIFIAVCCAGLMWFVNFEVKKGLDSAVAEVEGLTLTYTDLSVSIWDRCLSLENVETTLPQGLHLTAEEVRIFSFDQFNHVPHYITTEATGVIFDMIPVNVGNWSMPMQSLNIPTVKGDISLDYRYDPETMTLDLKTLTVKVPELGDAELSGLIDKLDLQLLRVGKFFGLRIGKMNLAFTNHSIVDTLIQGLARGLNISAGDALTQINAELTAMAEYAGRDENQVAENALRGLRRYFNDPGSVTVTANPVEPVPVLYFFMGRDIYDNLRLLNVEIKTDSSEDI